MLHDLRRRQQELAIDVEIPPKYLDLESYAWAMRGAWDSALVSLDRYTRESSDDRAPVWAFTMTATQPERLCGVLLFTNLPQGLSGNNNDYLGVLYMYILQKILLSSLFNEQQQK